MPTLTIRILGGGERAPFLLDDSGVPMFYPTLFTTVRLRNAGAAVNTIRNKLADILVLSLWEAHSQRDLIAEFSQSRFLSLPDIVSLRDFMKRDIRDLKPAKPRSGSASIHAFIEAHVGQNGVQASVCASHHFNRMTTMAEYLEFLATVLTQHKHSAHDTDAIKKMATSIRNHRPRGLIGYADGDPHDKSPPSELIDRFMAVSAVDHPHNPFRDPGIRLRNAILFGLLRYTGMRRGELLSLRIDDLELGNEPLVWLRRNQDDVSDPRPYQGVPKTKERALPLPRALADQVQDYILNVRSGIPQARRHPYLIVSHQKGPGYGKPLSAAALGTQIMRKMRQVDPAFSAIHPHAFRHHFNYELSCGIDEHNRKARSGSAEYATLEPISEARELDIRASLNGHRSRESGVAYNQRHIRETADRAVRELQTSMNKTDLSRGEHES